MKKTFKKLGIIAIAVIFTLSLGSCDTLVAAVKQIGNPLVGSWTANSELEGQAFTWNLTLTEGGSGTQVIESNGETSEPIRISWTYDTETKKVRFFNNSNTAYMTGTFDGGMAFTIDGMDLKFIRSALGYSGEEEAARREAAAAASIQTVTFIISHDPENRQAAQKPILVYIGDDYSKAITVNWGETAEFLLEFNVRQFSGSSRGPFTSIYMQFADGSGGVAEIDQFFFRQNRGPYLLVYRNIQNRNPEIVSPLE